MDIDGVQFTRKGNLVFVRDLAGTERYKYRLLNPFVDHDYSSSSAPQHINHSTPTHSRPPKPNPTTK